ncbi:exopolysaccharide transport family protein [Mesorhizobium sp. SB112]|uniref:GumC family protein n=1 Tax=Mesorhizobium sp. SB112 TaxID=3151853 RepID=UPI003267D4D7
MSGVQPTASDVDVDLGRLFSSLLRNWLRVVIVALIVTGLAFVLAWLATPLYKAETRLLIETRESVFTRPNIGTPGDQPLLDEQGITSQVQLITSSDVLLEVARKLELSKRPEFDEASNMSIVSRALIVAGLKSDPMEIPSEERVLRKFREKLSVYNVERSRVIVIEFSSADPKLAADVPNAIADAFLAVSGEAKQQANSAATDWLEPEIADLTKRVKDAEAKVAAYRSQSDLLIGQNNSVLATQQLSEMSSELSRVRAARASTEATAQSVREALQAGGSLDSVPEVLASGLIQRLRERQVQLRAEIADLSTTLLGNHPRVRSLNSQLSDLNQQIRQEGEKVLRGLATEAQTAQLREGQLVADLNRLKTESGRAGEEEVELRALEREATAQRELLESYLARYREASSRNDRAYLPADARIFSRAVVPDQPFFPKIVPIVGAAFVASLLIMAIVTLLQELFSGRAMRPAGTASFEPVEDVQMPERRVEEERPVEPAFVAREPLPEAPIALTETAPGLGEINIARAAEGIIASGATRALFISPGGDEAAATAVLVAREIADTGLRVLLLDLTSSGAASRPMLESTVYPGITNLLASEAQFSDVIYSDHYSDCHIIPVGTADAEQAMRAADRLPIIIASLITAYDVVVIECGPADATSIKRLVGDDTAILVSVIEPHSEVIAAANDLRKNGYEEITLVTPIGHEAPEPQPGRNVA